MTPLAAYAIAARPRTLPAALAGVLAGSAVAYAEGGFRPGPALAAAGGALAIQIGTNFTNDAGDFVRGADGDARSGPPRAAASGWLTPAQLRAGAAAAFGVALLAGCYLTAVAGPVVIAIGLASIAAGIAYTSGPFPLAYNGLGDLFVLVFFGFVAVAGTAYVQLGRVPAAAWLAGAAVGALATAILTVNNVRDAATDAGAGKKTLAVLLGRRAGVLEYASLLGVAFAVPLALLASGLGGVAVLGTWLALPFGARLTRRLARERGEALNGVLAGTAALLAAYAALLSLGIAAGGPGGP